MNDNAPSPRVSVVVASYNYASVIRETLDGLAAQTWRDFEVLVIDNASTDNSVEIIEEYVARDPRFRLLMHPGRVNKGLPGSVKLGIAESRGEFVAFCEADDIWTPDHLGKCMALVERSGGRANFIINEIEPFGDPERCRKYAEAKAIRRGGLSRERNRISPRDFRRFNWIFTFSVVMARKSALAACDIDSNPLPSTLDWWLWRQLALENDIWVVHEKLTRWRLHKQSFTVKDENPAMLAEGYDMIAKMDRLLVSKYPEAAKDIVPFLHPEDDFHCEDGVLVGKDGKPCAAQPSFSVALASDAPEALRRKTLGSLDAQTYRNFELIDGEASAFDAAEAAARNEWLLFLQPGDVLREKALETLAARIVLQPGVDALYGKALCAGTNRKYGEHTLVGGDIPCADGLVRPFSCIGAFAIRKGAGEAAHPPAGRGDFPERWLYQRLCGAKRALFIDRILLLYDDGQNGRDPDGADRRRLAKTFTSARLEVANRRSVVRYALAKAIALLRRDGLMFYVKSVRYYAFSSISWKWLIARVFPGIGK